MGRGTADRETKVLIDELCPECKGEGCYYAPAWAEWNKAYTEVEKEIEAVHAPRKDVIEQIERKLRERGIEEPQGPEEPDCPTCEGSGRDKRYVTLLELGDMIEAARAARRK